MTGGAGFDEAIVTEIKRELGITLALRDDGRRLLRSARAPTPPAMWSLAWVADYPGRNDFLGVLLGTGASNNYGRWSSAAFDAAIAEAGVGHRSGGRGAAAYDRAEDDRPRRGPGRPARLRPGLVAVADRAARGGPERARHRPDGGTGMGATDAPPAARPRSRPAGLLLGLAPVADAARRRGPTFGRPTATSSFETGVDFTPAGHGLEAAGRVELLLTTADAIGPTVIVVPNPPAAGPPTLTYLLDPADGHIARRTRRWSPAGG